MRESENGRRRVLIRCVEGARRVCEDSDVG